MGLRGPGVENRIDGWTMRVLLVDDDPEIVRLASFSLAKLGGFEVESASSVDEAVTCGEAQRFDAVLLDRFLGDIDGLSLLLVFKSHPKLRDIPVIIFSAEADQSAARTALEMGAAGVIAKPFDLVRLPDQMRQILLD